MKTQKPTASLQSVPKVTPAPPVRQMPSRFSPEEVKRAIKARDASERAAYDRIMSGKA